MCSTLLLTWMKKNKLHGEWGWCIWLINCYFPRSPVWTVSSPLSDSVSMALELLSLKKLFPYDHYPDFSCLSVRLHWHWKQYFFLLKTHLHESSFSESEMLVTGGCLYLPIFLKDNFKFDLIVQLYIVLLSGRLSIKT